MHLDHARAPHFRHEGDNRGALPASGMPQLIDDSESEVLGADPGHPLVIQEERGGSAAAGTGDVSRTEGRRRAETDPALVAMRLAGSAPIKARQCHVSPCRRHNGGIINGRGGGITRRSHRGAPSDDGQRRTADTGRGRARQDRGGTDSALRVLPTGPSWTFRQGHRDASSRTRPFQEAELRREASFEVTAAELLTDLVRQGLGVAPIAPGVAPGGASTAERSTGGAQSVNHTWPET